MKGFLRTKALWIVVALLALNAVLFAATPGLAVPRGLSQYFFGPKLVRAEIVVRDAGRDSPLPGRPRPHSRDPAGAQHAHGSRARRNPRDGADRARRGRLAQRAHGALRALRRGMVVTTVRLGDEPAETVVAARS